MAPNADKSWYYFRLNYLESYYSHLFSFRLASSDLVLQISKTCNTNVDVDDMGLLLQTQETNILQK